MDRFPSHIAPGGVRTLEEVCAPWTSGVSDGGPPVPRRRVDDVWMVLGITLAVAEHRRRIALLLGRLDELRRDAVVSGVAASGTVDVGTLLAYFGDRLRVGDARLSSLVDEFQRQRRRGAKQEDVRP